ncbi:type II secretion system protein N [Bordetella hinzii]|uniref:type II secretion system protein N n=1 Tax=Bordetella hinzii TaxID=103855 RepID=UPI0005180A7E|nr:type II secretion system protein N [Bordetella hinzii]
MRLALASVSVPGAVRVLAACACACAVGVWGVILLAPAPAAMPAPLAAAPAPAPDNQPVARWFGKDEALTTEVKILGVIAAGPAGAAVLSIDGGPPAAYRAGQALPGALVLRDIGADTVVLDQRGRELRLRAPLQAPAPAGLITVH